jgi:hypothetical protein
MSHATSRRAVLAGTATAPAASTTVNVVVASDQAAADLIFALIEEHKARCATYNAAVSHVFEIERTASNDSRERLEARSANIAASNDLDDATVELISTEPTTMEGVAALLAYVSAHRGVYETAMTVRIDESEPDDDGQGAWHLLCRTLARALARIGGCVMTTAPTMHSPSKAPRAAAGPSSCDNSAPAEISRDTQSMTRRAAMNMILAAPAAAVVVAAPSIAADASAPDDFFGFSGATGVLARLEKVVETLRDGAIGEGWSIDEPAAARALAYARRAVEKPGQVDEDGEAALINFLVDHGQSLDWVILGTPVSMIWAAAAQSARAAAVGPDAKLFALGERMKELLPAYFLLKGPAQEQWRAAHAEAEAAHGKRSQAADWNAARRYDAVFSAAMDRADAHREMTRISDQIWEIAKEVQRTPAVGLKGLGVKALGLAWQQEGDQMDDDISDFLHSVVDVSGVSIPAELTDLTSGDEGHHAGEEPSGERNPEPTEVRITELNAPSSPGGLWSGLADGGGTRYEFGSDGEGIIRYAYEEQPSQHGRSCWLHIMAPPTLDTAVYEAVRKAAARA